MERNKNLTNYLQSCSLRSVRSDNDLASVYSSCIFGRNSAALSVLYIALSDV